MVMGSQVRRFSSTYTDLSHIHRWSGCKAVCALRNGSSPMAPRAAPPPQLQPPKPNHWRAGRRSATLYSGTRAGAPRRRGGRRAGARQDLISGGSRALGPGQHLGEQPWPHSLVAFSSLAPSHPAGSHSPLLGRHPCRWPLAFPLPGGASVLHSLGRPDPTLRISHCVQLVSSHPRPEHQASAGNSQSMPGSPESGPPPRLLGSEENRARLNQAWPFPDSGHHLKPVCMGCENQFPRPSAALGAPVFPPPQHFPWL